MPDPVNMVHEPCHTYGLPHANYWSTYNKRSSTGAGESQDAQNPFDLMGYLGGTDLNVLSRHHLGWLAPANVFTVETNGAYRVSSYDNRDVTGTLALKIRRDERCSYWIGLVENLLPFSALANGAYVLWGFAVVRSREKLEPKHGRVRDKL